MAISSTPLATPRNPPLSTLAAIVEGVNPKAAIFSSDLRLVHSWRRHLMDLNIDREVCMESSQILPTLMKRRYQAVVLDCTCIRESISLIDTIRALPSCKGCILITIVDDSRKCGEAFSAGANFVLSKTTSNEMVQRCLRIAQGNMLRDLRNYRRFRVDLQATLCQDGRSISVKISNLSKGGCGIEFREAEIKQGLGEIQFELPGSNASLRFRATIAWSNTMKNAGLRFENSNDPAMRALHKWLDTEAA
jgi:hypothetical protein